MNRVCIILFVCFFQLDLYGQGTTTQVHRISTDNCEIQFHVDTTGKYRIVWQTDTFINVSVNEFSLSNGNVYDIIDELQSTVVLFQNCGQKSNCSVLLPQKMSTSEIVFENVVGYDSINKNLLYLSDTTCEGIIVLNIYNLFLDKVSIVKIQKVCSAANPIECIDCFRYEKNKINIYYYGEDNDTIEKKVIQL